MFRRSHDSPPPAEEPYSLAKIQSLLDEVGKARLKIISPRLKVLLTRIAQNGEAYLVRNAPNGKPSDSDVMQFQEHLQAAIRVVEQYVIIQNDSTIPQRDQRLADGFKAIDGLATRVMSTVTPSGSQAMTNFTVDVDILSAQRFG